MSGASKWSDEALARRLRREHCREVKELRGKTGITARMFNPSFWVDAALAVSLLRKAGRANVRRPDITRRVWIFADLPAVFDGLRILHLSDLHADMTPEVVEDVRRLLSGLEFDAVVATGDYRESATPRGECGTRLSAELLASTGKPVFACLGNHDLHSDVPILEAAGVRTLVNESAFFEKDGERLYICGVDDPGFYRLDDFSAAYAAVPAGAFSIVLVHNPCAHRKAENAGASFMLCGHTHGGQICLPGGIPLSSHSPVSRCFWSGPWKSGRLAGYTSRGIGTTISPVRFFCPGEIAIHTLLRVQNPA